MRLSLRQNRSAVMEAQKGEAAQGTVATGENKPHRRRSLFTVMRVVLLVTPAEAQEGTLAPKEARQ